MPSVHGGRGVPGPQGFWNELAQNNKSVSGGTMVCTCNGKDPVEKCACWVWGGGGLSPGTPPHLDFEPKISPQKAARRVQKEGLGKAWCGSVDSGWEGATLGQLGPPLHCRQQYLQGGGVVSGARGCRWHSHGGPPQRYPPATPTLVGIHHHCLSAILPSIIASPKCLDHAQSIICISVARVSWR